MIVQANGLKSARAQFRHHLANCMKHRLHILSGEPRFVYEAKICSVDEECIMHILLIC